MVLKSIIIFSLLFTLANALFGKQIDEERVAYLGIPYAKPPTRELRFQNSEPLKLNKESKYEKTKIPCIEYPYEGGDEDCLYLNFYRHAQSNEKTNTLVFFTNRVLSEGKSAALATKDLNFVTAAVRTGVFGHLNGALYGVRDVINVIDLLNANKDVLNIGKVTVWAEGSIAEAVDVALQSIGEESVRRAILVNGNSKTRTIEREKFEELSTFKFSQSLACDLPSETQSLDCLRTKETEEIVDAARQVHDSFLSLGDPFRVHADDEDVKKHIPTILGLYKKVPIGYSTDSHFTAEYSFASFKRFLASVVPDSLHRNGPLLRRMLQHQYVHSKGDKHNTYFLFEQQNKILLGRDFLVPTWELAQQLADNENKVYVFEYGIDNPPTHCLQDGGWDDIQLFCDRISAYFTRFATKGAPTEQSCNPNNPTWPALRASKRDYFIRVMADGKPDFNFEFYLPEYALWTNLLPSLDKIELAGRRDSIFVHEEPIDPLLVEDDVQEWHVKAASDGAAKFEEEADHAEL